MNHQVNPNSLAENRLMAAEIACARVIGGWCGAALFGVALLSAPAMAQSGASAAKSNGGAAVTVTDPRLLTRSGFLSDYDKLKKTGWGNGIECWRDPGLDAKKYDKAMISRIVVSLKPSDGKETLVDPSDLKKLTDYFSDSLVNALKPQMAIVTAPEPGTVMIAVALTSLKPTSVARSVTGTLIPFGFVAEAGSGVAKGGPTGSTPYLGETGMEMQFLDATSGAVLGECRDTTVGRKYAAEMDANAVSTWATGYMGSFQAWSYAKNAFDKWSLLVAQRFAALRGVASSK